MMNFEIIGLKDMFLAPIFLVSILFLAYLIGKRRYSGSPPLNTYFIAGLSLKLMGALAFTAIYQLYYSGGDTTVYYKGGTVIWEALMNNPGDGMALLFQKANHIDVNTSRYTELIPHFRSAEGFTMHKICAVVGLFTFNSYIASSLVFAVLSFSGLWVLYLTFLKKYPSIYKQLALAVLFIPSVTFWGSGMLKDTVTLGCLGWIVYCCYALFFERRRNPLLLIMLAICIFLVLKLKAYIFLSLIPALFFGVYLNLRKAITNRLVKWTLTPLIIVGALWLGFVVINTIGNEVEKYKAENLENLAKGFHSWHSSQGESAYSLGDIEFTPTGIASKIPASLNVTYFRPFLWETHSPVIFLSALESLAFLVFTLYVILTISISRFIRYIYSNPEVGFCFVYAFIFGFAVGFTSFNFGALVRYKIPCMPFYLAMLFLMLYNYRQEIKAQVRKGTAMSAS